MKRMKDILAAVMLICVAFLTLGASATSALGNNATRASSPVLFVALYEDAERENKIVDLTYDGSQYSGWPYYESGSVASRYLGVSVSGLNDMSQYRLAIGMDPIIYIEGDPTETSPSASMTFEAATVNTMPVNGNGQYKVNSGSYASLTYAVNPGSESLAFGLPVSFDSYLWNLTV